MNLYTYVENSPIMYIDPTGHWSGSVADAGGWDKFEKKIAKDVGAEKEYNESKKKKKKKRRSSGSSSNNSSNDETPISIDDFFASSQSEIDRYLKQNNSGNAGDLWEKEKSKKSSSTVKDLGGWDATNRRIYYDVYADEIRASGVTAEELGDYDALNRRIYYDVYADEIRANGVSVEQVGGYEAFDRRVSSDYIWYTESKKAGTKTIEEYGGWDAYNDAMQPAKKSATTNNLDNGNKKLKVLTESKPKIDGYRKSDVLLLQAELENEGKSEDIRYKYIKIVEEKIRQNGDYMYKDIEEVPDEYETVIKKFIRPNVRAYGIEVSGAFLVKGSLALSISHDKDGRTRFVATPKGGAGLSFGASVSAFYSESHDAKAVEDYEGKSVDVLNVEAGYIIVPGKSYSKSYPDKYGKQTTWDTTSLGLGAGVDFGSSAGYGFGTNIDNDYKKSYRYAKDKNNHKSRKGRKR